MTWKIAPFGAGAMGGAIGTRLADTGNALAVLALDAARVRALVVRGARPAGSAAESASVSDSVAPSLDSPKVVDAAVLGPDGVAESARPGTLIFDMSSIDPPCHESPASAGCTSEPALGLQPVVRLAAGFMQSGLHVFNGTRTGPDGDLDCLRDFRPFGFDFSGTATVPQVPSRTAGSQCRFVGETGTRATCRLDSAGSRRSAWFRRPWKLVKRARTCLQYGRPSPKTKC